MARRGRVGSERERCTSRLLHMLVSLDGGHGLGPRTAPPLCQRGKRIDGRDGVEIADERSTGGTCWGVSSRRYEPGPSSGQDSTSGSGVPRNDAGSGPNGWRADTKPRLHVNAEDAHRVRDITRQPSASRSTTFAKRIPRRGPTLPPADHDRTQAVRSGNSLPEQFVHRRQGQSALP
jgi:hypothetical protein